jgi:hypothetical protein
MIIYYTARANGVTTNGVAIVPTTRTRPSWADCARAIPGFITGEVIQ